jgi:WD40 repeat protein
MLLIKYELIRNNFRIINSINFSPNSKYLIVGKSENILSIFDVE